MPRPITIIFDDREKNPWNNEYLGTDFIFKQQRLKTGDYTIQGMEKLLCIERKENWEEIASNLSGPNLKRFQAELDRMQDFPLRFLIVQSDITCIPRMNQYSQMIGPTTIYNWLLKIQLQYGIMVMCIGTRYTSKHLMQEFFRRIVRYQRDGSLYYNE